MEKYEFIQKVGAGSYGWVYQAIHVHTREVVAIKILKRSCTSLGECLNSREVKCLKRMNHPNIVKLKEIMLENNSVYFVFEYMDCNLQQLMQHYMYRQQPFSEDQIRRWCFQIFQGLHHMHQRGYFHRDLKPENLLVSGDVMKIADVGMAREISKAPGKSTYTEYVTTRWYRAPEVLLGSGNYGSKVDIWAMGAIMAELFLFRPLFQGDSPASQVYKICSVLGRPTEDYWANGLAFAKNQSYQSPQQFGSSNLSSLIPTASMAAINLISWLCSWDPCKRPSAAEALQHPFFTSCLDIPPSLLHREAAVTTSRQYVRPVVYHPMRTGVQWNAHQFPNLATQYMQPAHGPSLPEERAYGMKITT